MIGENDVMYNRNLAKKLMNMKSTIVLSRIKCNNSNYFRTKLSIDWSILFYSGYVVSFL
jgi:hypothetical protein